MPLATLNFKNLCKMELILAFFAKVSRIRVNVYNVVDISRFTTVITFFTFVHLSSKGDLNKSSYMEVKHHTHTDSQISKKKANPLCNSQLFKVCLLAGFIFQISRKH